MVPGAVRYQPLGGERECELTKPKTVLTTPNADHLIFWYPVPDGTKRWYQVFRCNPKENSFLVPLVPIFIKILDGKKRTKTEEEETSFSSFEIL